jgi:hypothetical protein
MGSKVFTSKNEVAQGKKGGARQGPRWKKTPTGDPGRGRVAPEEDSGRCRKRLFHGRNRMRQKKYKKKMGRDSRKGRGLW